MKTFLVLIPVLAMLVGCAHKAGSKTEADAKAHANGKVAEAKHEAAKVETKAKEAAVKVGDEVVCTKGKEERKLSISTPEGGGCEVHYFKAGADSVAASAKKDTAHCASVVEKIKTNLTGAGYACK